MRIVSLVVLLASVGAAAQVPGDARRGATTFKERGCTVCHSFQGTGGTVAPDLGRRSDREYTPERMAGLMWNHAPTMWQTMRQKGIAVPALEEKEVADLFAYFFSIRYFAKAGDAARGKAVFTQKHCTTCHAPNAGRVGPPISEWSEVRDPIAWVREMWNHSGAMYKKMREKGVSWPQLNEQELVDLLVYFQNLPEARSAKPVFAPADPRVGETVFQQSGCRNCHTMGTQEAGKVNLLGPGRPWLSFVGFTASMWNHAPKMHALADSSKVAFPTLAGEQMNHLTAYLFWEHFFHEAGDARRGRRVFERKQCAACHEKKEVASAPELTSLQGRANAISLTSSLWKHGPQMLASMEQRKKTWPVFSGTEMADLITYLNQKP